MNDDPLSSGFHDLCGLRAIRRHARRHDARRRPTSKARQRSRTELWLSQ
jgi:hypothetical protein